MFALFLVLFSFTALGQCKFDPLSQEFIDHINSLNTTWKAKQNFPGRTISELQRLCGTKLIKDDPLMPPLKDRPIAYPYPMPTEFDARTVWPHCTTISKIGNQGHCGSCWAFSTSSAMNDRYCIKFNHYVEISAQDMISCCAPAYGQNGCDAAPLTVAYDCWLRLGIVTGGQYGSNYGCQPYTIPTCSPHSEGTTIDKISIPDCNKDPNITPPCSTFCRSGYSVPYYYDKHFGSSFYPLGSNVQAIQQEIMLNGPVTLGFDVYDDLMHYASGVYKPTPGSRYMGGHAVKAVGWGTENGVDYWLLANSWGPEWGDKGFFKFHRGFNECNIEANGMAGIPL